MTKYNVHEIDDGRHYFYIEVPNGWKNLITELIKDINKEIRAKGIYGFHIHEITEKYGMLRIIANYELDCFKYYEIKSCHTCVICGEEAEHYSGESYWDLPYCKEHMPLQN